MSRVMQDLDALVAAIAAAPRKGVRRVVAVAGAPASGKSTLAEEIAARLRAVGSVAQVVPMDGFHMDNQDLVDLGLLARKGAPNTFDAEGFVALAGQLSQGGVLAYPTFDRARDVTIPGGGAVSADCDTVVVEGNYLLFDAPVWRALPEIWDVSVFLSVPEEELRRRLVERWLTHGLSQEQAEQRAEENDLENAQLVQSKRLPSDIVFVNKDSQRL
ncbi:AAA family ATPase [Shimia sp. MMG029]|uniref:AAA family ATPase n=1 Tax=Shimia sp. MMG029 TaxID=3021978 RepID=UPI0022FDD29C|nr:AAA family ATPase [Shimia sp. MMG029]MDA5558179.1 AAA family ATPase [Shimia sp. MMG029]